MTKQTPENFEYMWLGWQLPELDYLKITIHLDNNYFLYDHQHEGIVPTLRNNIDEFNPIFKDWNEVSQKVSKNYGTNSLGEMTFWHNEFWSLYLHDIYTTSHCRKSWSR